jgi:hypothetical protein
MSTRAPTTTTPSSGFSSTWFPLVDHNPRSWVPNIFEAGEDDFITAAHRAYRSAAHPTAIEIAILGPKGAK